MYDQIYGSYGWFGIAFAALGVVVGVVAITVWFDRRR